PDAPPSALPIQGVRARDRRRLLHLDRIVGSQVRRVGHPEAADVTGRTKCRAPGVLNDSERTGHDSGGALLEPHPADRRRVRPAWRGGLADSRAGESKAVLLLMAHGVPVLSEPG